MSAPARARPPGPRPPAADRVTSGQPPARPRLPWGIALSVGAAVLLASAPVGAIVQDATWLGAVVSVVLVVVAVGLLLHRLGPVLVTIGQAVAVLLLLTARFGDGGALGVVPGPASFERFGSLITGAGEQIGTSTAPVPASPEILFLVTAAFGVVAIAVYLAAVGAGAPAAAGVPLLATFAVPAALADDLLPWWAMAAAAAGFGLLLIARRGARRQLVGGVALVAVASLLALVAGLAAGFVGTAGRFDNGGAGSGAATSVGLSPFAALRGQLTQSKPVELFRVRGLPQATYLRALTLRDYVPQTGWQVTRPDAGPALPGTLGTAGDAGQIADVQFENLTFRDYWLPLYGVPLVVGGLPTGRWTYDDRNDTAYTARPRQENTWQERALLPTPTAQQLRDAKGPGPGAEFLNVAGVDQRVKDLAKQVAGDAPTDFDKAIAFQQFFTGPGTTFSYSLATAPSGGDDALVEFLTVGKKGYCEQFASAMAVMLRAVGVPARVAIGFTGGTEADGVRSVSTSDAHAWVEAWFPGTGWTVFDPTPLTDGRTITPPYVAEAIAAQDGGATGSDAGQDPTAKQQDQPAPPTDTPAPAPDATPDAVPVDSGGVPAWVWALLAVLVLSGLAAVPAALRARGRKQRLTAASAGGAGAAGAAWAELLAESTDRGVEPKPSDTVRATARRIIREHRLGAEAQRALRQVVGAVEASWYGGAEPAAGELVEPVQVVRAAIADGSALTLRERVLPRSVLNRSILNRAGLDRALRRGPKVDA